MMIRIPKDMLLPKDWREVKGFIRRMKKYKKDSSYCNYVIDGYKVEITKERMTNEN